MNRAELIAYGGTLASALGLIVLILGAQGLLDRMERDTEDRIGYRKWVAEACLPGEGESATAIHSDGKLHCTIYSQRGYGLVPIILSAAVAEVPQ